MLQEEFAQLFKQLDALKDKNLRLGNRHLAEKISAMQEVSKRVVWSTNIDKKPVTAVVGGFAFTNHHGCNHPISDSQKSLVVNKNGKKPFMKEVTV